MTRRTPPTGREPESRSVRLERGRLPLPKILRRLFCDHDFEKTDWFEVERDNLRYSNRLYVCRKCGTKRLVDERNDPFA